MLTNALPLIDDEILTLELDNFEFMEVKKPDKSMSKPLSLIISLNYLNSIYTRKKGIGQMNLTITSWTKGPNEALNKTSANVQLFGDSGVLIDPKKWDPTGGKATKAGL